MNKKQAIPIRCKGNRYLPFSSLKGFQGMLKELSKKNAEELKLQIKKLGWVAPVFVWDGDKILDGHQRLAILPSLLAEGYTIDKIPIVDIDARSKEEAAKILLSINSRYGIITDEGLYEFMHDMDIDVSDLKGIELPDVDLKNFATGYFGDEIDLPELPCGDKSPFQQMTFILHDEQVGTVKMALDLIKEKDSFSEQKNKNSNGNAIAKICGLFIDDKKDS